MSLQLNKVTLAGRIATDIELKTTPNGVSVIQFTLAVDRRTKERQTDFIRVTAWRNNAEFISKYFKTGNPICLTGSIQTRKWQDKDGNDQYSTDIIADDIYFVESRAKDDAPAETPTDLKPIQQDEDLPF